jgi:hypothetical protein
MRRLPLAMAVAASAALAVLPAGSASAHSTQRSTSAAAAVDLPVVTSPNVHLLTTLPNPNAISGEFSHDGKFFYVSSANAISIYDVSIPAAPRFVSALTNLVFENEAMTYGERRLSNGVLNRFVLVGVDLYDVTPTEPHRGNIRGKQVLVIDVTRPEEPHVDGRTPYSPTGVLPGALTTSSHTVQCVTLSCEYAYTAGSKGKFSIIDIRDDHNPKQVKEVASPSAGANPVFVQGAGHYWDFDGSGRGWHTGSGGATVFDVRNPLNPVPVNATNSNGIASPYNDFILHNSQRPNAGRFTAGAPASLANGNVLLVTEEDYFNDGEEVACDQAGTIQTWYVPDLNGAAYRAGNPTGAPSKGNIRPLDISNVVAQYGGGASTPVGGFCSAHWFDFHQSGILAQGYYQQGLRFVDVRNPRDIKQYGYFTGGATEVWDAYWVPQRDAKGVPTGRKSNIVYAVDFVRGIDVLCVNLPGQSSCPTGVGASAPKSAVALPLLGLATLIGAATAVRRRLGR